jgi:hypothetical protein
LCALRIKRFRPGFFMGYTHAESINERKQKICQLDAGQAKKAGECRCRAASPFRHWLENDNNPCIPHLN